MPCDAILASRVMVTKEIATEDKVKELTVACSEVSNEKELEYSYEGTTDGTTTVTSELSEPTHKAANRGMKCRYRTDAAHHTGIL